MTEAVEAKQALTCFVSAATQTDTSVVIAALSASGVQVRTADDIAPGENIALALGNAVLATDFVCVVLDDKSISPIVAFEAGLATANHRPIVVVSSGRLEEIERSPLADMSRILYSVDKNGETTLRRAINAFVENIRPAAVDPPIDRREPSNSIASSRRVAGSQIRGAGLERYIAERLARAGAVVNTEDRSADILAMFPALGGVAGLVVVEVKASRGSEKQQRQNERTLQNAMMNNKSVMGLLVYGEPVETRIEHDPESLLGDIFGGMLIISTDQLSRWSDADLLRELTHLRSIVLHGQR